MELFRQSIDSVIKDFTINAFESITLSYGDSVMTIGTYHDQDCCESVYGDFEQAKYIIEKVKDKKIINIVIKGIEDMGFLIIFEKEYDENVKVFIPCYNSQNGYYSSDLKLVIQNNLVKSEVDISNFVEQNIC